MPIGESLMNPGEREPIQKQKKVIDIDSNDLDASVKEAFSDIVDDMKVVEIEGDKVVTIEGSDPATIEDSVAKAFGSNVDDVVEVDWAQESKAVVAVAKQQILADAQVIGYIQDPDYKQIVLQTIDDMTTNEEQIRIFQEGINAATDKAKYVEQATKKLVDAIKSEIERKIIKHSASDNNS